MYKKKKKKKISSLKFNPQCHTFAFKLPLRSCHQNCSVTIIYQQLSPELYCIYNLSAFVTKIVLSLQLSSSCHQNYTVSIIYQSVLSLKLISSCHQNCTVTITYQPLSPKLYCIAYQQLPLKLYCHYDLSAVVTKIVGHSLPSADSRRAVVSF